MKLFGLTGVVLVVTANMFAGLVFFPQNSKADYISHDPIGINGDANLFETATREGWPGNGMEENPFIIEGYEIDASNRTAIWIRSTSLFFVIKDCKIRDTSDYYGSIVLWEVSNGAINNCVFENCTTTISLHESLGITITNNTMDGGLRIYGYHPEYWNTHNIDATNKIDGRSIYYWNNRNGGTIPPDAGQVIMANCTNITVENQELTRLYAGLQIVYSSNNTIRYNNISSIEDNHGDGITLQSSHDNKIQDNIISTYESNGIDLRNSHRNIISGNDISNGRYGIVIIQSINISCMDNTMTEAGIIISGDKLEYWNTHHIDTSNTVDGKPILYWKNTNNNVVPSNAGQVFLANCTNIVVENQDLTRSSIGIEMGFCSNNTIMNNIVNSYIGSGISITYSNKNYIKNNNITNNHDGIFLWNSNENELSSNRVSDNQNGFRLIDSNNNLIKNNDIFSDHRSIYLINSSENIIDRNTLYLSIVAIECKGQANRNNIINNNIFQNEDGISIENSDEFTITNNNISSIILAYDRDYNEGSIGISAKDSHNHTVLSNNIMNNSIGIYFRESNSNLIEHNYIANNNVSGIIIGSSNGNIISDNKISSNNDYGISLFRCSECEISNNTAENNNDYGIRFSHVERSIIFNNTALNNVGGLSLSNSNENRINNNYFSLNNRSGIYFFNCTENEIMDNYVFSNSDGLYIRSSSENTFHHNEIIDNSNQVFLSQSRDNIWDDGNGEGNYWSDYEGIDEDGDGVGDTELPHQNVDDFPLTDNKSIIIVLRPIIQIIILILIIGILWFVIYMQKRRKSEKESSKTEPENNLELDEKEANVEIDSDLKKDGG
jgi:parallel beta-helix repeat protein